MTEQPETPDQTTAPAAPQAPAKPKVACWEDRTGLIPPTQAEERELLFLMGARGPVIDLYSRFDTR